MSRKTSCILVGAALAALLSSGAFAQSRSGPSLLGEPIAAGLPVDKVITIDANTRWANVMEDDIVKFVAGGKEFSWRFASTKNSINLKDIAPPGTIDRDIRVYLAPNPLFMNSI